MDISWWPYVKDAVVMGGLVWLFLAGRLAGRCFLFLLVAFPPVCCACPPRGLGDRTVRQFPGSRGLQFGVSMVR